MPSIRSSKPTRSVPLDMGEAVRTSTRKRTLSDASNASTALEDLSDAALLANPSIIVDAKGQGGTKEGFEGHEEDGRHCEASQSRRSDGSIADCEVDAVYEEIYAQMESEAILEILADLERELVPAYLQGNLTASTNATVEQPSQHARRAAAAAPISRDARQADDPSEQLLWHITATPSMMRELAASVASSSGGASSSSSQSAAVSVSG